MQTTSRLPFGIMPDGTPVEELILRCGALSCHILTYGGVLRALTVPDKNGNPVDVLLGMDSLEDYLRQDKFYGALVGRFANRIGKAKFTLGGTEYCLDANDGANHLHGGPQGFDKQVWTVEAFTGSSLTLSLISPDGQQGYPGTLTVAVTYTLCETGLAIDYLAHSDRDTLCNLTNHAYFNLAGHAGGTVTDQYMQLFAAHYTPTAPGSIPTGEIAPVEGTPFDLRAGAPIGQRIDEPFEQLTMAGGYDHNWVIDGEAGTLRRAARAWSEKTGIVLEAWTDQPGIQFYAGNYLDGVVSGKGGATYPKRSGFCLETQAFPDAPNHDNFPSAVLPARAEYRTRTEYRFSTL